MTKMMQRMMRILECTYKYTKIHKIQNLKKKLKKHVDNIEFQLFCDELKKLKFNLTRRLQFLKNKLIYCECECGESELCVLVKVGFRTECSM